MVHRIGLGEHLARHEAQPVEKPAETPVHLREILEELGPTFVKLGQVLSTRPDIIPDPYIAELEKLQDTAPTLPVEEIYEVIESEFGLPVSEVFPEFDAVPIAAASLAQVHAARLADGSSVIVKVQRPHIQEVVETDIEILYKRARFLESHLDAARTYGLSELVEEFAQTLGEELDYTREARNTDRLREALSHQKDIHLPEVNWNFTTSRILTLQRLDGIKVTEVPSDPTLAPYAKEISDRLVRAFLEQVFVDGFFHADPHPGNILVAQDRTIGLIDCGQVGKLDPESKAGAVHMLMAFEHQDARALADDILSMGIAQQEVDIRRLTTDLGRVLRVYYGMPARAVNMGQLLTRVLKVSAQHKVRLPVIFAVLGKVFANIDGICRRLDPDFNFTEIARGYVGRAVRKELRSEGTSAELFRAIVAARSFLFSLPEHLDRLMRKAVEGNLRIEFKHQGLEGANAAFRAGANRISIALIVAAIIVGSSLIVSTAQVPSDQFFGLPALGVAGYVLATIFGVWLIISIIRSGKQG